MACSASLASASTLTLTADQSYQQNHQNISIDAYTKQGSLVHLGLLSEDSGYTQIVNVPRFDGDTDEVKIQITITSAPLSADAFFVTKPTSTYCSWDHYVFIDSFGEHDIAISIPRQDYGYIDGFDLGVC